MTVERTIKPRPPLLARALRLAHSDPTRRIRRRPSLTCLLAGGADKPGRGDGALLGPHRERGRARATGTSGSTRPTRRSSTVPRRRAAGGSPIKHLRGLRPMRGRPVTHALLRAIVGQLITMARGALHRVAAPARDKTEPVGKLGRPASPSPLRRLRAGGARWLPAARHRKATALGSDLPDLADPEPGRSSPTLEQERGISHCFGRCQGGRRAWALRAGAVVGDLGLLKTAPRSRAAGAGEGPGEMLTRSRGVGGLACVYLMAGASRGLVPLELSRAGSEARADQSSGGGGGGGGGGVEEPTE